MKLIISIISILISFNLFSQNISIDIPNLAKGFKYYAYCYSENNITIIVENESCDSIMVTTNRGKIRKDQKNGCNYIFTTDSLLPTTLTIKKVYENDTVELGKRELQIMPWPFITLFGKSEGSVVRSFSISIEEAKSKYLSIEAANTGLDAILPIEEFKIYIIRDKKIIYAKEFKDFNKPSRKFTDEELEILRPGDKVIYFDISYQKNSQYLNYETIEIGIRN